MPCIPDYNSDNRAEEDLENVPKISLYVSRCYYLCKRIVTYPEWLLLISNKGRPSTSELCTCVVFNTAITCPIWKCSS